jgi:hypothetical protein
LYSPMQNVAELWGQLLEGKIEYTEGSC